MKAPGVEDACKPGGPTAQARVRELDAESEDDMRLLGRMHSELLSFGPMAKLGEQFVREICYRAPMLDGLLRAAAWEVDHRPVGFIAYTSRAITFHRRALRNHWFRAALLVGAAVLTGPRRLMYLYRAARVLLSRRSELRGDEQDPVGEVVCIAVRPNLAGDPGRRPGGRASTEMLRHASEWMRTQRLRTVRMIVDADNRPVIVCYGLLGARLEAGELGGIPSVKVVFDLESLAQSLSAGHPGR